MLQPIARHCGSLLLLFLCVESLDFIQTNTISRTIWDIERKHLLSSCRRDKLWRSSYCQHRPLSIPDFPSLAWWKFLTKKFLRYIQITLDLWNRRNKDQRTESTSFLDIYRLLPQGRKVNAARNILIPPPPLPKLHQFIQILEHQYTYIRLFTSSKQWRRGLFTSYLLKPSNWQQNGMKWQNTSSPHSLLTHDQRPLQFKKKAVDTL
jgi:hypothetical protein